MKSPNKKVCVPACFALLALLLSVPQNAAAMNYIFTKIADNSSAEVVNDFETPTWRI